MSWRWRTPVAVSVIDLVGRVPAVVEYRGARASPPQPRPWGTASLAVGFPTPPVARPVPSVKPAQKEAEKKTAPCGFFEMTERGAWEEGVYRDLHIRSHRARCADMPPVSPAGTLLFTGCTAAVSCERLRSLCATLPSLAAMETNPHRSNAKKKNAPVKKSFSHLVSSEHAKVPRERNRAFLYGAQS
jgi:hypothetical protein